METINLYFIGPAGSGKSTLVHGFSRWMQQQDYDAITVNLDPGIENAPYDPDIDIRDWINLNEIMIEHGVGPNGAQVVAADMLALNINELKEVINEFETDYVIFDTPGQMELFVFRQSGKFLIDALGTNNSMIGFLFDPVISRDPSGFISLVLQAASVEVRFNVPFLNILSKSDLLSSEEVEKILNWSRNFLELDDAIHDQRQTPQTQLNVEFLSALESYGSSHSLFPVSATAPYGMEDIYNNVQQVFYGGEDLEQKFKGYRI